MMADVERRGRDIGIALRVEVVLLVVMHEFVHARDDGFEPLAHCLLFEESVLVAAQSSGAATSEAAVATRADLERIDEPKVGPNDGHRDELSDSVEWVDRIGPTSSIPAADHQWSLIVRIDQANEVAEDNAMLVAETGAGKDHGGKAWIVNMDRDSRADELGLPRREYKRRIDAGSKVEAGGPGCCVSGQVRANAFVEDFKRNGGSHGVTVFWRESRGIVPLRSSVKPRSQSGFSAATAMRPRTCDRDLAASSTRGTCWQDSRLHRKREHRQAVAQRYRGGSPVRLRA